MGKFIQLPQDLFDASEVVHRVPVASEGHPDRTLGTAYVGESEIVIHIQNDTLVREVGPLLEVDLIKAFYLGLVYVPADRGPI